MLQRSTALVFTVVFWLSPGGAGCHEALAETGRDQAILQIQQLIVNGDLEGARALLTKSAMEFPDDAGFDNLSGVLAAEEHRYADAESSFRRAIERDPKLTAASLNLGRLYQEHAASDPRAAEKALSVYEHVISYDAANAEANYQSAVLLSRAARYQESLSRLERLPAPTRDTAQVLSLFGADYAALGDKKRADDAMARLIASKDFSEPDVRQTLDGLRAGKRDDLTVKVLLALGEHQPLATDLQHILGLAYEAAGKLDQARTTLERVFAAGDPSVSLLMELARIGYEQRDYKGSLGYVAHARDLEPGNAYIHYAFGVICVELELLAEARNSFQRAVQLEPNNATYNYAMGMISSFNREPEDAAPYLERYLSLNPRDSRAKLALGADFVRAKDYSSASPWLLEAAKDPRTSTAAHYYLGSLALETGQLDEAATEFRAALKARPDYADALAELGHYYLIKKEYREAMPLLERALELDADHFSANFYLLLLYARTGNPLREAQSKRYDDLLKRREQKSQEFLRMVTVQPFDSSQP